MTQFPLKINFRKLPKDPNMFEFTIATPALRSQFILPRQAVNNLRGAIEKALLDK
ncbi:MAG: hypothetical protein KJ838_01165 [Candidatus Omnitrophica bacterium]|nr:hypothetical protein [Candidatus Omnitrophota bacterium]